ncbi:MAG: hypothetical protein U0S48_22360 [Solirubrobacteraceae bacterium]
MATFININLTNLGATAAGGVVSQGRQVARAQALGDRMHLTPGAMRPPGRHVVGW